MKIIKIHIGSHYFGSGNFGDDLMLAGFLSKISQLTLNIKLTCCSSFNLISQKKRFPEIFWLPYDEQNRQDSIKNCDIWLCLGGSVFQSVLSDWCLQHLSKELEFCQRYQKKMFFLGVSLNDYPALQHPVTHELLNVVEHIWTRDQLTAQALRTINPNAPITTGSDLAHLFLKNHYRIISPNILKTGIVANFEENRQNWQNTVENIIYHIGGFSRCSWIVQEVRLLPGSELAYYHNNFSEESQSALTLIKPDYDQAAIEDFLIPYQHINLLITSRYHSALIGGWLGCRVVLMERNLKLKGLSEQWHLPKIHANDSMEDISMAINIASTVNHEILQQTAYKASEMCDEFYRIICL